jgi:hypothetical protein
VSRLDADGCTMCGGTVTAVHWNTPMGATSVAASCDEHGDMIEALRFTDGPNGGLLSSAAVELAALKYDAEHGRRS